MLNSYKLSLLGTLSVNGWTERKNRYPLSVDGVDTAAYTLYQLACIDINPYGSCGNNISSPHNTMSVRWGDIGDYHRTANTSLSISECHGYTEKSRLNRLITYITAGIIGKFSYDNKKCPYHTTIFADEIAYIDKFGTENEKKALGEILNDSIVLYSLTLEGLHDLVESPVHGAIPGVYYHAMALENLIFYGSRYTRANDQTIESINTYAWILIVVLLSLIMTCKNCYSKSDNKLPGIADEGSMFECGICRLKIIHKISNLGKYSIMLIGILFILLMSIIVFILWNYEPINVLWYMGLVAIMTNLVSGQIISRSLLKLYIHMKWCFLKCMYLFAKINGPKE